MLALWLEDRRLSVRHDLARPEAFPGEALVRVSLAGICNTDLELLRGYYPYRGVPGHEFVGRVERGSANLVGRRVVGEINATCGECSQCGAGRPSHCERRSVLGIVDRDGAFAEYLSLPERNLHSVPDDLPDELAVFTEPLAAALEIGQQLPIEAGQRVLVVGDGKLGLLVAQTIARTGCDLLVVGRHDSKLALLQERGIHTTTDPGEPRPGSYDVAVEVTGNPAGFATARAALRARGTLVLKSTYAGELTVDAASIVVDEITLIGSRCGPFAPALELLREGAVDVASLIEARYPLASGQAAFEHARRRGALKVLLEADTPPGA